jgi:hypothetical protein
MSHPDSIIYQQPLRGRVEADPNEVEATLLNLAVNARDAMAQAAG